MNRFGLRSVTVSGVFAAALAQPIAAPALVLAPHIEVPVGDMPHGLAAGDVDGDGDVDLVVGNVLSQDISLLRNVGDGSFELESRTPAGAQVRSVAIGDVDADGAPDLLVGLQSGTAAFAVLPNDGTGTFLAPQPHGLGPETVETILPGHYDSDANLDVALVHGNSGDVLVFRGRSGGDFHRPTVYPIPSTPLSGDLAAGDVDEDGDLDLVASFIYSIGTPAVLLNQGNGSYALAAPFNELNTNTAAVAVGPLDDQTGADIAQVSNGSVRVFANDGSGSFGAPRTFEPGVLTTSVTRMCLADLDASGTLDLIITGSGSNELGVLLNDGLGAFDNASQHSTGAFNSNAIAADFNADGYLDVAASNRDGHSVSILLNETAVTSVGGPGLEGFELQPVRPNPARGSIFVSYRIPRSGPMTLTVHDVAGRLRRVLVQDTVAAGSRTLAWDGRASDGTTVAAGVYFLRMETNGFRASQRIIRLR